MKRKSTLLEKYRMDKGGAFKFSNNKTAEGIQAGAMLLDSGLNLLDAPDKFGTRSGVGATASGALKGAAAGSQFGIVGTGVGALAGAVTGLLGNKKAQEEKQLILTDEAEDAQEEILAGVDQRLATNPNLVGNRNASMYRNGGSIKGKPSGKFSIGKSPVVSIPRVDILPDIATNPGKLVKLQNGGMGPGDIANGVVKNDDRNYWNGFVDYVAKKGYANSPELDKRDTKLSRKLFDAYNKETNGGYDYDTYVPAIQKEIAGYRDTSIKRIKEGKMAVTNPDGSVYKGDRNAYDYDNNFMPGLSNVDGWAGSKTTAWKFPKAYLTENGTTKEVPNTLYANQKKFGGRIKMEKGGIIPSSSTTMEVKGPSHAKGGVMIPDTNIEVEGGETITDDGFVFSKELGFADIHKNIAKAKAKNEKKPSTVLNKKTQVALERKEGLLKIYQEQTKRDKGLPNEIDNTAAELITANKTQPNVMKNGGKIKKAIGGDLDEDLEVTITAPRMLKNVLPGSPNISTTTQWDPNNPSILPDLNLRGPNFPVTTTGTPTATDKFDLGNAISKVAPFASNIANSFRSLPQPAKPVMDQEIIPDLINLDADRAEATRQRRGADKVAAASIKSNNTVAGIKAANLTQGIRAANEINQAENNANTQIKNSFKGVNAQIKAGNNAKTNQYNSERVSRQIKQQELDAANIADVGNKIQLIDRDRRQFELEDTKNLLTVLADPTGATIRAAGPTLKRIIKDPAIYQQILDRGKEMEKMNDEDRKMSLAWIKAQMLAANVPKDILNSDKAISADAKATKNLLNQEYLKSKIASQQKKK